MFLLYETTAGYGIFKVNDEKLTKGKEKMEADFDAASKAISVEKFRAFKKKEKDMNSVISSINSSINENKASIPKPLRSLLKRSMDLFSDEGKNKLVVCDTKLAASIKDKFKINCVFDSSIIEMNRVIRSHIEKLLPQITTAEMNQLALKMSHNYCRYKIKFSSDKVDTMIVQSVSLLDDLDKELNNYAMRCKEWYGWHFPELAKIVPDNLLFAKCAKFVQRKESLTKTFAETDVVGGCHAQFLKAVDNAAGFTNDTINEILAAAQVSIGTDISDGDLSTIIFLCDQIISLFEYRTEISNYLVNRMNCIAPNLSNLVGELVGARLIAHAGSLLNLAKQPSSTIQVFGAEKALFRALKTKKNTPKYGLIYHSNLVSQTPTNLKGKMSRSLASKAALAVRCDALTETDITLDISIASKQYLEQKLHFFEKAPTASVHNPTTNNNNNSGKFPTKFAKPSFNSKGDFTKKSKFQDASGAQDRKRKHANE